MRDFTEIGTEPAVVPLAHANRPDAGPTPGNLSYSLAPNTTKAREKVKAADGFEWYLFVPKKDARSYERSPLWSLFSRLPNVAARHKAGLFESVVVRAFRSVFRDGAMVG